MAAGPDVDLDGTLPERRYGLPHLADGSDELVSGFHILQRIII